MRELRSREGYEAVFVPGSVFASEGVTKSLPQKNVDGRVEGPQLWRKQIFIFKVFSVYGLSAEGAVHVPKVSGPHRMKSWVLDLVRMGTAEGSLRSCVTQIKELNYPNDTVWSSYSRVCPCCRTSLASYHVSSIAGITCHKTCGERKLLFFCLKLLLLSLKKTRHGSGRGRFLKVWGC